MEVRDGRHAGINATGSSRVILDNVTSTNHGTHGVVLENATGAIVRGSRVENVGCSGIRATAGTAATLDRGNLLVEDNAVSDFARWKRTYQPGMYWGGCGNTFRDNTIKHGPHNGFLGGGNFEDGVDMLFEGNTIEDCSRLGGHRRGSRRGAAGHSQAAPRRHRGYLVDIPRPSRPG